MFSHVTLGTNDLDRAAGFYDAVMATLGQTRRTTDPHFLSYGDWNGATFFITDPFDEQLATVGNGTMVAFRVAERSAVDAFHQAALAHGGTDEGAPGIREHYDPNYYGAYVRDPDGNKLHCVCTATA